MGKWTRCDACGGSGKQVVPISYAAAKPGDYFFTVTKDSKIKMQQIICPSCNGRGEVLKDGDIIQQVLRKMSTSNWSSLKTPPSASLPAMPKDLQDMINILGRTAVDMMMQMYTQTGISDYQLGRQSMPPPLSSRFKFDRELKQQLSLCLSNISNDYHPTTEMNTLALGVLAENVRNLYFKKIGR
jgi:hypothetical protein